MCKFTISPYAPSSLNLNDSRSKSISFRDINTNEGRCTIEHSGEKKIPSMASEILHCAAAWRSGKLFFMSSTVAESKFVTKNRGFNSRDVFLIKKNSF